MKKKHRLKVLEGLLDEWQGRLRLRDWSITIREVTIQEMDSCDHIGRIEYSQNNRTARIKVLRESHYEGMTPYDAEATVVHELLHLHFAPFDAASTTPAGIAQEQAINAIATALVNTKRRKP